MSRGRQGRPTPRGLHRQGRPLRSAAGEAAVFCKAAGPRIQGLLSPWPFSFPVCSILGLIAPPLYYWLPAFSACGSAEAA